MSRAQTLVLALLVLHVLLGALCLVIGRGEHKSAALRWWGAGLLMYAGGLAVTIAGIVLPQAISGTVGNSLITLAPVLCAIGVLAHTPFHLRRSWVLVPLLLTVALLVYANVAPWERLLANMIAPTPMAVAMFVLAAWMVMRRGPEDARIANHFLAGIMVLAVATWITRVFAMLAALDGTDDKDRIDLIVSLFAIMQMVTGVGATLALFWIDVRIMQAELSRIAHSDVLTGLPNRRAVRIRFGEELARAARYNQRLAFAIFDIDRFKQINDRYGHFAGDTMLQETARAMDAHKRNEDVLARLGGEEFVVLLAQQSREGALEAAERLREAVAATAVVVGGNTLRATISGGVAIYPDDGVDWDHLYAVADRRLYEAKRGGRDRIEANG